MQIISADSFDFDWPEPADAELSWRWDEMHIPQPIVPMAQEYRRLIGEHRGQRTMVVNGYPFSSGSGLPKVIPAPDGRSWPELWFELYEGRARSLTLSIRDADYASMSTKELAGALPEIFKTAVEVNSSTHFEGVRREAELAEFCEAHFGGDGARRAGTLLQGFENETAAAGTALEALGELVSELPEVAAAITAGDYGDIESRPGGELFRAEFDAFLDRYGWRAETWADLATPTWTEDPTVPMAQIAQYLAQPEHTDDHRARSAGQREKAVRAAEEALPDQASREQLHALIAELARYVAVREGRALWQLTAVGVLRVPLLELGRRFVAADVLDRPDDAVYLYFEDADALARGRLGDARTLVAGRRSDHARWQHTRPPELLGADPDGPLPPAALAQSGAEPPAAPDDRTVTGTAASAGIVRGVARVIFGLDEAAKLHPGEVLVCRSTAPPWTPLLAVAGAIVTNTGGVLSHTAIVAREYAIPAVVGTKVATDRIPDGATVTVDGDRGTVTIES